REDRVDRERAEHGQAAQQHRQATHRDHPGTRRSGIHAQDSCSGVWSCPCSSNERYRSRSPAEKQQNRTSRTATVAVARTLATAMRAASAFGYPYTPVLIAGNAIERQPFASASARLVR